MNFREQLQNDHHQVIARSVLRKISRSVEATWYKSYYGDDTKNSFSWNRAIIPENSQFDWEIHNYYSLKRTLKPRPTLFCLLYLYSSSSLCPVTLETTLVSLNKAM